MSYAIFRVIVYLLLIVLEASMLRCYTIFMMLLFNYLQTGSQQSGARAFLVDDTPRVFAMRCDNAVSSVCTGRELPKYDAMSNLQFNR